MKRDKNKLNSFILIIYLFVVIKECEDKDFIE